MSITIWAVLKMLGIVVMIVCIVGDIKNKYLYFGLGILSLCLIGTGNVGSTVHLKEDIEVYSIEEEKMYELMEIADEQYYAEDINGYIYIMIKNNRGKLEVKSWPKEDVLFTVKEDAEQKQTSEEAENTTEGTDMEKENIDKKEERDVDQVRKIVAPKLWNTAMILADSHGEYSWVQISLETNSKPYKVNMKTKLLQEYVQNLVKKGYVLFRNGYKENMEVFRIQAIVMSEYEVEVNEDTKEIYLTLDKWNQISNRFVVNKEKRMDAV